MDQDKTNNAILEQLNYIDNFIDDNNLNLNFDLSAFADDEFIFADEDKPKDDHKQDKDKDKIDLSQFNNLNNLPRFPVPPGAKSSLVQAGLNQNQIDLLSALIAQYQSVQQDEDPNQNPGIPPQQSSQDLLQQNQDISLLQPQQNNQFPFNQTSPGFMNENFLNPMQMNSNSEFSNDIGSSSTADALNVSSLPATGNSSGENNSSNNSGAEIDNDLDKRRRNTAASARFRIKKKLKEKQMEEKIENLQELISKFENKIENLELENKLLRKVINDKSGEKNDNELKRLKERILRND